MISYQFATGSKIFFKFSSDTCTTIFSISP